MPHPQLDAIDDALDTPNPDYRDNPSGQAGSLASAKPWHTHVGMSDQEIRARALECAVSIRHNIDPLADPDVAEQDFWALVGSFEHYIKTGEKA